MIPYLKDIFDLTPYVGTAPYEGVRYNPKKLSRERFLELAPFSVEPAPFHEDGFYITGGQARGTHPYHLAGLYYFQEPSAMGAATALQIQGDERVLDLCAAPGSKATAIAARLQDGLLVANEPQGKRAAALAENLERMGISRAVVTQGTAEQLSAAMPGYFDKVLVDSPCSGEGMFRKYPAILEDWSEELVQHCAARSRTVLEAGAKALRSGGRLIYSTCTYNLEENERLIQWFLERHPEFELTETGLEAGRPGLLGLTKARRIFPADGGEGHFICALRHMGTQEPEARISHFKPEKQPEAAAALKELLKQMPEGKIWVHNSGYYSLLDPDLPRPEGVRILRAGLQTLILKGRQWRPAHHLALCLPREAFHFAMELDPMQAAQYVHGQELPCKERGYGVVSVAGVPLGFVKASGGMAKNHYPKGLRTF